MKEKEGVTNIKKLALLAVLPLVAGLLVFNGEQRAAADDLSDGLVGYWKFDEGSGSIVLDSSGYGNNGTINGGASYTSTGIAPTPGNVSALTFDGVNDFVAVPHADVLDMMAAYTIAAWVNINNVTDYQTILSRGDISGNDIELYWHPAQGLTVAHNRENRGIFDFVYFVSPPIGTLFHLAVVFDGTVVKAYYDGVPAALSGTGCCGFSPVLPAPLDTNQGWLIGKGSFEFDLLKGLIDEMRIYNRALSEDEIVALANPPILSVSPTSLDFGNVLVGSTKDLTFTVTNSGGGTLTGSVTTSAPFSIVSGSSFSLTAGASQTVTVRFSPTTTGTFLGNASVSSNGGSASVSLSGTGVSCTYSISPTSQTFSASGGTGSVSVSTSPSGCSWTATSNASWITITSGSSGSGSGTVSYSVAANTDTSQRTGTLTIAGQTFTVTQEGACIYSISPTSQSFGSSGGTGSVSVSTSSGCSWTAVSNASWITITSGSSGSGNGTVSYSVAANTDTSQRTGTMTIAGQTFTVTQSEGVPTLSVSPTSLAFGEVTVGSSSDQSFTVTNIGGGTFTGTATTTSPFSIMSGGSFSLSAGATQTVTVRFSPTSTGAFADIVSVSSNGGNTSVTLSGTGTEVSSPVLSVFPTSLSFGEVALGSSKDLLFTVSNAGTGTLTGTVTTSSPFSITSGGTFSLGTGASQVVTVRFSPTVESFVSSTAAVNSNGGNAIVTLTGTGITIQSPTLSVIPTSLDFGSVQVGSSSDLTFFVQNSGGGTLVGTVSTSTLGFGIVSGTSFTLTAGASQTVTVRFSPPEGGTFSGTVTVSSNGGGDSVTVSGIGTEGPQPILTVTPSILNFGMVRVGKSKDLSFTVQNTGEGTLAGTGTATDPFSVVTNSSFTLDAGDLLLVTARFSPPTTGTFTGAVEFTSNGGDFTATVTGRGRGKLLPFNLRKAVVPVAIDIEPDMEDNSLDCQSRGEIAVGIMDVGELPSPIEVSTLELEGAVAQSWVAEDVDRDGEKDDLVVYFGIQGVSDEVCQEGITSFFLTGDLVDGTPIEGSNEVNVVRAR